MAMLVYQRVSGKKNTHMFHHLSFQLPTFSWDPPFWALGPPCLPWPPLSSLSTFTLHKGLQMAAVGLIQLNLGIQCRHLKVIGRSWLLGVLLGGRKTRVFWTWAFGEGNSITKIISMYSLLGFSFACSIMFHSSSSAKLRKSTSAAKKWETSMLRHAFHDGKCIDTMMGLAHLQYCS